MSVVSQAWSVQICMNEVKIQLLRGCSIMEFVNIQRFILCEKAHTGLRLQSALLGSPECLPRILFWPACTWEGGSCRIFPFTMATYILANAIPHLSCHSSCPQTCQPEPLEMPALLSAVAPDLLLTMDYRVSEVLAPLTQEAFLLPNTAVSIFFFFNRK